MKHLNIFLVLFLTTGFTWCQKSITGLVTDANTNKPLPFATVISSNNVGTITDRDGQFELNDPNDFSEITISYVGFKKRTVSVNDSSFLNVSLIPLVESLQEVVLVGGENPALQIIRNTIKNRRQNDIERALESFRFKAYNKLVVSANPDSIQGDIDSIFVKKDGKIVFKEVDSTNFNIKKNLSRSHFYMTEKASEYLFTKQKGKREHVIATRMAGFQEPIYEFLAIQLQSFSFYKDKYTLFATDYINPIANNALNEYSYKILDTVNKRSRPAYMIYYKPKKTGETVGMQGVLYIDMESYALQKAIAQLKAVIDIKAEQIFEYYPKQDIWFPKKTSISLTKGENEEGINLFGGSVQFSIGKRDSTVVHTNEQEATDHMYLRSFTKNFDVEINKEVKIKGSGLAVSYDENAAKQEEAIWQSYRTDSITRRGRETYRILDSVVAEQNVEKNIRLFRKLAQGYIPTKYFDFELRHLFGFNNYEGYKLGVGGVTNSNVSNKFRVNGFFKYGFRDKASKYGLGAAVRFDRFSNTWLGAMYSEDLRETGDTYYSTLAISPFLIDARILNTSLFHRNERAEVYLTHNINPKIQTRLEVATTSVIPLYEYSYNLNGEQIIEHDVTTASFGFNWNPFSEYTQTPNGLFQSKIAYPQFTAQYTKGIDGLLDGQLDFSKVDLKATHIIKGKNRNTTEFTALAGIIVGDAPLQQLYHNNPNNPIADAIMKRFTAAGNVSFETMYFNEFFSDRYVSLQIKKKFNKVRIAKWFNPGISLITRFAIGDISNIEDHSGLDFNSIENGYFESGIELNSIFRDLKINPLFQAFGLSLSYRYGAYHLPNFDDNIALKFTFNSPFGF
ncbi:DUF5686 family protein [Sungkyunkwania multivorans]|uniref:DUF5686 family protein n=1 Tax=Sungkyunkwania multivorans TaxID=1173618 RepID=A0ABW3CTJ9_9FLAO